MFFQCVYQTLLKPASGTTAQRPVSGLHPGKFYFDTTLGKPVFFKGPGWVDATGASV
jgi:hypothetical protein